MIVYGRESEYPYTRLVSHWNGSGDVLKFAFQASALVFIIRAIIKGKLKIV